MLDNTDPQYITHLETDYHFEESQNHVLFVYNYNPEFDKDDEDNQILLGSSNFLLSNLICAQDQVVELPLFKKDGI